jgi:hypothetical protein
MRERESNPLKGLPMKPRAPEPRIDERQVPQEPACVAHRWPPDLRERRDPPPPTALTADFDAAAAIALGHGCYRMRAHPFQ